MTATRARPFAAALLLAVVLAGCAAAGTPRVCDGKTGVTTMLYFGLSRKDGGQITARAWERFVHQDVARAFPSGFTVLSGRGYWRRSGTGRALWEPSRVILRVHDGAADDHKAIVALVALYKRRFGQEAVLRVDHATGCITF